LKQYAEIETEEAAEATQVGGKGIDFRNERNGLIN